ncbi:U3 snoRNP protein [Sporothrix stenoceras]|uniref:U3 snoRNP protein n=1 Tax=Sporothrix stenoceras TaxID=5173 RepID=A0ABR3YK26_9PEZI
MADSSTSSLTSTSHTLTIATANPYGIMMAPGSGSGGSMPTLGDIASALAFRDSTRQKPREAFLTPNAALSTASSEITQVALGTFAGQISDEQQERLRQMHAATAARKKRKRANKGAGAAAATEEDDDKFVRPIGPLLKIRRVHVNGFETPQIWQQSNRILATSTQQSQAILDQLEKEEEEEEGEEEDEEDGESEDDEETATNGVNVGSDDEDEEGLLEDDLAALEAEEDEDDDEDLSMGEDGEDDFGDEYDDEDEEDDEDDEEDEDDDDTGHGPAKELVEDGEDDFGDEYDDEDEEDDEDDEEDEDDDDTGHGPAKELVEDADGLNDGFFDINEFNKQSQWFEAQDARADPNTDAASEDDELDWHGDPFAAPMGKKGKADKKAKKGKKNGKKGRDADSEEEDAGADDDDEEDGPPIFGNMDLDAPSGESDIEDMDDTTNGGLASGNNFDDGMDLTANDIFYKDFFAPPAKKRDERARPGRKSAKTNGEEENKPFQPDDADVQRAIKDVRRDLFEQLSDASGDEDSDGIDALSDVSAGDVRSRRSAHERRQAKILAEIRRLEAEAVKGKNWTVSGEASASARPVNSLLEEDLDFEHIGKPVPVITQEITEDIEALVKRRILEQSFDEVRRHYGTGFGENEDGTRRGLIEIDDSQAKKGLAAVYEEEHQQAANPDTYVSQSDERVQAEEREVERMWLDVSAKLDALSNWHYKPRPSAPQMSVVADVATVTIEDAQPATAQGVSGGASMLAPQEVYKPGADKKDKDKGIVVVSRSGLPVARDEMTREEKLRRRRRNKERIRKSGSGLAANGNGTAATGVSAAAGNNGGSSTNASQADTIATLKRAGVKVIGRKGELQDVEGNKPQVSRALSSGNFKL